MPASGSTSLEQPWRDFSVEVRASTREVLEHGLETFLVQLEQTLRECVRNGIKEELELFCSSQPSSLEQFNRGSFGLVQPLLTSHVPIDDEDALGLEPVNCLDDDDHEWMQRPWYSHFFAAKARPQEEMTSLGTPKNTAQSNKAHPGLFHRPGFKDENTRNKRKTQKLATSPKKGPPSPQTADDAWLVPSAQQNAAQNAMDLTVRSVGPMGHTIEVCTEPKNADVRPMPPGVVRALAVPASGPTRVQRSLRDAAGAPGTEDQPPLPPRRPQVGIVAPMLSPGAVKEEEDDTPEILLERALLGLSPRGSNPGTPRHTLDLSGRDFDQSGSVGNGSTTEDLKQKTSTSLDESPLFSGYAPSGGRAVSAARARKRTDSVTSETAGFQAEKLGRGRRPSKDISGKASQDAEATNQDKGARRRSLPRLSEKSDAGCQIDDSGGPPNGTSDVKEKGRGFRNMQMDELSISSGSETGDQSCEHPKTPYRRDRNATRQFALRACASQCLDSLRNPSLSGCVKNEWFDYLTAFLVLINAVLAGVRIDHAVENVDEVEEPIVYRVMESTLCVAFVAELLLRICVYRGEFFFGGPEVPWNVMDCGLVLVQLVAEVLEYVDQQWNIRSSIVFIRFVRFFRVVRIIQLVRIVHFIKELKTMVASVAGTLRSLCWVVILILILLYVCGVLIMQVVVETARHNSEILENGRPVKKYYGSLPRALLTLYQTITGGVDWDDAVRPLMDEVSPLLAVAFSGYIGFSVLAMMNVITGLFVEAALSNTKSENDVEMVNRMRQLFEEVDFAETGQMTWDQFESQLATPGMELYFRAIDLDMSEARGLFKLLDLDESGSISVDEFVMGCLRLRGNAKAIDLATLMFENRRNNLRWRALADSTQALQNRLSDVFFALSQVTQVSQFTRTIR